MAASPIASLNTVTTDAQYLPVKWSPLVLKATEKNFVARGIFENRTSDAPFGTAVHFPTRTHRDAQSFVAGYKLEEKLAATTDTYTTITIDQKYVSPFLIPNDLDVQSQYDNFAMEMAESGYAIAKQMDTHILSKSSAFTNTIQGVLGTSPTNIYLTACKRVLDKLDVPDNDRAWIFDPTVIEGLLNLTGNYFTSMDFSGEKGLQSGQIGRMLLGSPVYQSNNLPDGPAYGSPATTSKMNLYVHKQAIGYVAQTSPKVESEYNLNMQGRLGNVRAMWGSGILRGDHGVGLYGK